MVNDGSKDRSEEICISFLNRNSNIRLYSKENGGAASARNLGLSKISSISEYILFLDSDDVLIPNSIMNMVNIALESKSQIVMPDRYIKKFEKNNKEKVTMLFSKKSYISNPILFAINVMIHEGRAWRASAILYSTKLVIDNNAIFPEGHTAEDLIFNLQVLKKANKITFFKSSNLVNLKHTESVTATFQSGFDVTIAYIDEYVRKFLAEFDCNKERKYNFADALLCRNILVYLVSIMSAKVLNNREKKRLALSLLNDEKLTKGVLQKKYSIPYFSKLSARIIMPFIYCLVRHRKYNITVFVLSKIL